MTNSLTTLQAQLMNLLAFHEYNSINGATPTCAADVHTWFWADELAKDMGITEKAVGGVVTSLQEAGLIHVNIVTAKQRKHGDDSTIGFTQLGFEAWRKSNRGTARKVIDLAVEKRERILAGKRARQHARRAARKAA